MITTTRSFTTVARAVSRRSGTISIAAASTRLPAPLPQLQLLCSPTGRVGSGCGLSLRHSSSHTAPPPDQHAYSNMPAEPQYQLPTDAPANTFELYYFALHGRAEQIRLLLEETQQPYINRLLTQWQLRKLKAAGSPISNADFLAAQRASPLPFGGLPLLRRKEGGVNLAQTSAILQFVAESGGLMPSDALGRARAQMIVAGCEDLFQVYWPVKQDQNRYLYHSGSFPLTPGTHADFVAAPATHLKTPFEAYTVPKAFRREALPRWLTYFEALLGDGQRGGSAEYFVDNKFSYVDVVVFAHLHACTSIEPDCLKAFPLLSAHFERVQSRPHIAAYLEKRPASGL